MIKRRKRNQLSNNVVTRQTVTDEFQRLVPNYQEYPDRHRGEPRIFPRWCPELILALTLLIRINYVIQKKNWWILHPDEVYQSMESKFFLYLRNGNNTEVVHSHLELNVD